jgi:hypothetical protein
VCHRLGQRAGGKRGPLTGPNPTDRGKSESKVHLITDRNGLPLSLGISGAIYDALNRPERTFPSWPGKSVPGSKEPLRRVVDPEKIEDNRKKSIKECKKVWGDYAGSGLECVEYPFASTKEGSTKGDNRFSIRLIDGKDNRKGGERLNEMYTLNRVLNDDPFYVKITN